ncbi:MAG: hypothetical protein GWO02_04740 [Gammaproteobacteria bacterium]|nr:hypothetical protein [Gammaproteobacteria bacterium]
MHANDTPAGRAPAPRPIPRRLYFRVPDDTGATLGQVFRVTVFEPMLIGRFQVVGMVRGARVAFVAAEALPGALIHPAYARRGPVALAGRRLLGLFPMREAPPATEPL